MARELTLCNTHQSAHQDAFYAHTIIQAHTSSFTRAFCISTNWSAECCSFSATKQHTIVHSIYQSYQ